MRIPFSWLEEFLHMDGLDPERVAEELTLKSVETNLQRWDLNLDGVVVGRVVEKKPHPKGRLTLYRVQVGESFFLQLVSSDSRVVEGSHVFVALPNAKVGSFCVQKRDFEGVVSEGMLLSARELSLEDAYEGVLFFEEELKVGADVSELLGSGEVLLEIEPTPNRGDLLSVRGLARDISALMGVRKKEKQEAVYEPFGDIHIELLSEDCGRYRGAVIEGISVKPSPLWLRKRLWQSGIKTINNVVDITNYVMLQEGQPLHAFDLDLLELPLYVRDAKEGERLTTLMGSQVELSPLNLLIADSKKPLALAGVVGGLESSVKDGTRNILLESAHFNPYRIRRSARSLGIQTDSSYRFERNVDIEGVGRAQDIAISLILELAGGDLRAIKDVYPKPYEPKKVFLSLEKYRRYSGEDFDRDFIAKTLTALEIEHQMLRCGVEAYIPSHRAFDMSRDVDLIEELLRVRGYESFSSETLSLPSRPFKFRSLEDRIRSLLVSRGLYEVITFSFEEEELYRLLGLGTPEVEIVNPLVKSQRFMRTSLLPSLLKVCLENHRRYNYSMAVFEIGKVFTEEEENRLAFLLTGYRSLYPEERYDVYDAHSLVLDIFRSLGLEPQMEPSEHAFLHPGARTSYYLKDRPVGFCGVLSPYLQEELEIKHPVILCEINLSVLEERKRHYSPISLYPPVRRDISLVVDKSTPVDKLISHIKKEAMVEEVKVFSVYTDPKLGEGKKSVSLSIVLRSMEGTLSDGQANELVERLTAELEERFSARLR